LPFHAPVRAWVLAEWALLPLRLFLGGTFVYAGLQKLANPNFFNAQSPSSVQAQLVASARISPVGSLLSHFLQFATPLGIIIALSELAIGLGALLGLWTRIAALGGAMLSFSLFLTVSFHASPFYTGADILFFFAWMPFILAGGGSRLSLDAKIASRVARENGAPAPELVPISFATVQNLCGHFNNKKCSARGGQPCDQAVCPVLVGARPPIATRVAIDTIDRRTMVLGTAAVAAVGASALILAGVGAEGGRLVGGAKAPTNSTGQLSGMPSTAPSGGGSTATTAPASSAKGTLLGPAKDVPIGRSATFSIPKTGDPGIIVQPSAGSFLAYDAVCPHAGCTVGYYAANDVFVCPCHGSEFRVSTGAVLNGPAPRGLAPLKVVQESDGNLYLQ
jgi:thiosulfate dehydrogenase [quinone] large subunit